MATLEPHCNPHLREAGVDEAGRGCLAGPVTAAAVILPPGIEIPGLNDSKQLSASKRAQLRQAIEQQALAWAVGWASPAEIDRINILNAAILAMHRALDQLTLVPEHLLVDGNRFKPWNHIPHTCMVKGDARFRSIAAASILAKEHRDALMLQEAEKYPGYGWERNRGYPTVEHRTSLQAMGPTPLHRTSFQWQPPAVQLHLFPVS
jgi:ribonuclease HII